MRWRVAFLAGTMALAPVLASAQKPIVDTTPVVEEFAAFDGSGFSPNPAAGQLDSDEFAGDGMSDGALPFGGSTGAGDWARGTSSGGVSTGGLYAWAGGPDRWLFVQPTDADFSPGTLTVRYVNQTASVISTLDVAYQIQVWNDTARASSWNQPGRDRSGSPGRDGGEAGSDGNALLRRVRIQTDGDDSAVAVGTVRVLAGAPAGTAFWKDCACTRNYRKAVSVYADWSSTVIRASRSAGSASSCRRTASARAFTTARSQSHSSDSALNWPEASSIGSAPVDQSIP